MRCTWKGRGVPGDVRRVTDAERARHCMGYVDHDPKVGNLYMLVEQSGDGFYDFVQIQAAEEGGVPGWMGVVQDRIGAYGHIGQERIWRTVPKRQQRLLAAGGVFVPLTDVPFPSDLPETVA